MNTVHFISLGCAKNQVDSEVMLGLLSQAGFGFTEDPVEADIIIINTCAFIEDAKKEAIDTILKMAGAKKAGKCSMLVVAGCLSQRYKNELVKSLPEVDLFVGAGEFHRIVELIRKGSEKDPTLVVGKPVYLYDDTTPRIRTTLPHIAYIKIAEGCFHPCSFCVIPKLRGSYRSRQLDSVISEAQRMLDCGVKEINLIAQDSTAYGRDLENGENLEKLILGLSDLSQDKWIRLFYAYPHKFPEGVIKAMKNHPDICPYLDIPIQHISNRILKSMRREGDAAEIFNFIDHLRAEIPKIFLRTSLIVGYPGETDSEFDELLDFVSWAKFDHLGVFKYSDEEGTFAAKLKNKVAKEIIDLRYDEIMQLQQKISFDKNRRHVGKVMQVLVDEMSDKGKMKARHIGQAFEIDGDVIVSGNARIGEFALVKITGFDIYDLVAEVVSPASVLRN